MKFIKLLSIFTLLFSGLALGEEKKTENTIASALEGKIVGVVDGNVTDVELSGTPEYYVFYASASW